MTQEKVYVQRQWTDQALMVDGFLFYCPLKRITMVRMLTREEEPNTMKSSGSTTIAEAGYWIAYVAGEALKESLDDYKPRSIEPSIFAKTYHHWDTPTWEPTPTEAHLQRLGCQPYYKLAGIWAKQLTTDTWVQGVKSTEPSLALKGEWLCIGSEGELWSITDAWFHVHYLVSDSLKRAPDTGPS